MKSRRPNPVANFIRALFVSPDEHRLRIAWRLLIHGGLILALTLIVGSLVLALSMGLSFVGVNTDPASTELLNLVALASILLATWIARRILDRRSFRSLGFNLDRHVVADLVVGFALPGLLFSLIYAFEWGMGWLRFQQWAWEAITPAQCAHALLTMLGVFIIVGVEEEVLSRGYHLQNLAEALNLRWAIFISSAIFSLLHLQNPHMSIAALLGLLAAGYLLAFACVRTRNLWLAIGLHAGWNFFEGTIFGFPVSGMQGFRLVQHSVEGPVWVTGGAFGPEAGLVVFPAILLGAVLIWLYTRRRSLRPSPLLDTVT